MSNISWIHFSLEELWHSWHTAMYQAWVLLSTECFLLTQQATSMLLPSWNIDQKGWKILLFQISSTGLVKWESMRVKWKRTQIKGWAGYHFLLQINVKLRKISNFPLSSVQFRSAAQSCLTLCDPMKSSTPGLPVHHQLPEFTQTNIHQVGDDIQPSHPLSSPFPPAPNPSQNQNIFHWVNSSHEVAKVLEFQL